MAFLRRNQTRPVKQVRIPASPERLAGAAPAVSGLPGDMPEGCWSLCGVPLQWNLWKSSWQNSLEPECLGNSPQAHMVHSGPVFVRQSRHVGQLPIPIRLHNHGFQKRCGLLDRD